ncbi:MAG: hypothetical protein JOZ54_07235, partial [Acidobacteria bacterium]|nr:hypothetical protein [Acidobacteriota bacterium]
MTPLLFVLILVFIATGAAIFWVATRRDVTPFLAVTMVLYFVNWLLAPIVMTILAWDRIINRLVLADLDVYTWYSIVEVGAYLITVVAFGLTRHRFRFITAGRAANWQMSPRLEIFLGVVSMVGSLLCRTWIMRAVGSTYNEG